MGLISFSCRKLPIGSEKIQLPLSLNHNECNLSCNLIVNTVCPTCYRTRHFFNNSNTNEDIATQFEQEYVHCVRNEKECVCSAPNCCDTEQRSTSQPDSIASATHCTTKFHTSNMAELSHIPQNKLMRAKTLHFSLCRSCHCHE